MPRKNAKQFLPLGPRRQLLIAGLATACSLPPILYFIRATHYQAYFPRTTGLLLLIILASLLTSWAGIATFLASSGKLSRSEAALYTAPPYLIAQALWLWPQLAQLQLPPPHDFPERNAQLLLAFVYLSFLAWQTALIVRRFLRDAKWKRWSHPRLAITLALAYLMIMLLLLPWLSRCEITGDEPHYLMMTKSMLTDGDLNLANNYQRRDYQEFFVRGELTPQGAHNLTSPVIYSTHEPGLPLLLLPGFALLGKTGARLTMCLISAALLLLGFFTLTSLRLPRKDAIASLLLFAASMPIAVCFYQIFPDLLGAALILLCYLLLLRDGPPDATRAAVLFLACSLMVWLNPRLFVFALLIACLATVLWRCRPLLLLTTGAPFLAALSLYMLHQQSLFGLASPFATYNSMQSGGYFHYFRQLIRVKNLLLVSGPAMFFDQKYGLLTYAPHYLFLFAGLPLLRRIKKRAYLIWLVLVVPYATLLASTWICNSTYRYLLPIIPLLLIPLSFCWASLKPGGVKHIFNGLAGISLSISYLHLLVPWLRFNKLEDYSWPLILLDRLLGGKGLALQLWPAYQWATWHDYLLTAILLTVVVTLNLRARRSMATTGRSRK